jgi:hypothetical protein
MKITNSQRERDRRYFEIEEKGFLESDIVELRILADYAIDCCDEDTKLALEAMLAYVVKALQGVTNE